MFVPSHCHEDCRPSLKGTPLLKDPNFLAKAFETARSKKKVQELWAVIGAMRRTMTVAYAALDNGLAYSELPKELTTKTSIKKGLEKGLFRWEKLNNKHKKLNK